MTATRAALLLSLALVGCRSGHPQPPVLTTLIPASTAGPFTIRATASSQSSTVPSSLRGLLTPLYAAKTFAPPAVQPLREYGLDHPVATIVFGAGALAVGGTDFDAHGFYVNRPGDPDVYLVLSANVRPLLDLVGVASPPPGP